MFPTSMLTRFAIAGAIVAAPLAAMAVPASAAPSVRVAQTDLRMYDYSDYANCDKPERQGDRDFQEWCAATHFDQSPSNPGSVINPPTGGGNPVIGPNSLVPNYHNH
ncbi:hypothetical protein [Nocardia panacis]|uniref:hypothetical protein n=1 Tax=Nocardia panacis TaxID=2340916 RepID=UPI0011C45441|nr:hypothetical protein [Nocardia panacis]